jgi:hypothetical protein
MPVTSRLNRSNGPNRLTGSTDYTSSISVIGAPAGTIG